MARDDEDKPQPHAFWSGTFSFGLVSVPVALHAAVRPRRISLRTLGPRGQPLSRRYFCSEDGQLLGRDDIVRGYPWDAGAGQYVIVSDEELDELAPEKSRDIDLQRFVPFREIDARLLERHYVLAPDGESTKAYRLLAETMERSDRVGVATFVMRGREHAIAVFARGGLLYGATLRFAEELRSFADVDLPEARKGSKERVRSMQKALESLQAEALDEELLRDEEADALRELAASKYEQGIDVVEVTEAEDEDEDTRDNVVDIMALLKQRMGERKAEGEGREGTGPGPRKARPQEGEGGSLDEASKEELYDRAKALDIEGRSKMSKRQLAEAIRKRSA